MLNLNYLFYFVLDHYCTLITTIIIIKLVHLFYKATQPFDRVFTVLEPTYGPKTESFIQNQLEQVPNIHPYGWCPLLESRALKKCQVLSVSLYDEDLVVYRDGSGEVHVFDAFCPHLGANIGIGGTVEGSDRLRCPFHGWTFNTDGQCVAVPGLDKDSLPKASIKKWASEEKNRMIWIWRHPDGREPKWPCINFYDTDESKLTYIGRTETETQMTVQDYGENAADFTHFETVHYDMGPLNDHPLKSGPAVRLLERLITFSWKLDKGRIEQPEFKTPLMVFYYPPGITYFMGIPVSGDMNLRVDCANPYSFVYNYDSPGISVIFHAIMLPLANGRFRMIENYYTLDYNLSNRLSANFICLFEALVTQRDSVIWQNKKYRENPYLNRLDSGIAQWRRWLNQFHLKAKTRQSTYDTYDKNAFNTTVK